MRVTPVHISLTLDGAPGEPIIWPLRYLRRYVTRGVVVGAPNATTLFCRLIPAEPLQLRAQPQRI